MKIKRRVISLIIALTMFIGAIPVFADSQSDGTGGNGSSSTSGTGAGSCTWDQTSQFLRISLFMAPRGEDGVAGVQQIDWDSDAIRQVGLTVDFTADDPKGVVYHSLFRNAREWSSII